MTDFQQDLVFLLLSATLGGAGGAYLMNYRFGRQASVRKDRQKILGELLPQVWDQARRSQLRKEAAELDQAAMQLQAERNLLNDPTVDQREIDDVVDDIGRLIERTTRQDRRQWNQYQMHLDGVVDDPVRYRTAHRRLEQYLSRRFDLWPARVLRDSQDQIRSGWHDLRIARRRTIALRTVVEPAAAPPHPMDTAGSATDQVWLNTESLRTPSDE